MHFNDRVFVFPDRSVAREAAARLAECNTRGSLWELVDLVGKWRPEAGELKSAPGPSWGLGGSAPSPVRACFSPE